MDNKKLDDNQEEEKCVEFNEVDEKKNKSDDFFQFDAGFIGKFLKSEKIERKIILKICLDEKILKLFFRTL